MAATRRHRLGARPAAPYVASAPQSCPIMTARSSPPSASCSAHASGPARRSGSCRPPGPRSARSRAKGATARNRRRRAPAAGGGSSTPSRGTRGGTAPAVRCPLRGPRTPGRSQSPPFAPSPGSKTGESPDRRAWLWPRLTRAGRRERVSGAGPWEIQWAISQLRQRSSLGPGILGVRQVPRGRAFGGCSGGDSGRRPWSHG